MQKKKRGTKINEHKNELPVNREVYRLEGRDGGKIVVRICKRTAEGDTLELGCQSSGGDGMYRIKMKDWEAISIIEGLARAVLTKKGGFD